MAVYQIITSVVLMILHIVLVKSLFKSQKNVTKSKSDDYDVALIIQLIILTCSNIICWFPTNIIYVITMFKLRYSTVMVMWTVGAVTPISCVINPCVFITTCIRRIINEFKKLAKRGRQAKENN